MKTIVVSTAERVNLSELSDGVERYLKEVERLTGRGTVEAEDLASVILEVLINLGLADTRQVEGKKPKRT